MIDLSYEYSISEVAEITGFAPHVLRYYEKEFDIDVPRRDSNHRYYTYREIELIQYIKDLKDKGFGNKQIKMIINSPETVFNQEETNLALVKDDVSMVDSREIASQISTIIEDRFFEKLSNYLEENHNNTSDLVEALKEEIIALRKEINSKEHDVLICENAKLRMKVKEKVYENVRLKEEIFRLKNEKQGFFKKSLKKIPRY